MLIEGRHELATNKAEGHTSKYQYGDTGADKRQRSRYSTAQQRLIAVFRHDDSFDLMLGHFPVHHYRDQRRHERQRQDES